MKPLIGDVHDLAWQKRQIDGFVDFAGLAPKLGYDGSPAPRTTPLMTCPSPHLHIAAAASTSATSDWGTAATVLPLTIRSG